MKAITIGVSGLEDRTFAHGAFGDRPTPSLSDHVHRAQASNVSLLAGNRANTLLGLSNLRLGHRALAVLQVHDFLLAGDRALYALLGHGVGIGQA